MADTTATPSSDATELDAVAFDRLVESLGRWAPAGPDWPPARRVQAEWDSVAPRLDRARRELSRILVVGVIGGTGTGKSTLVNALAGAEVTVAGDVARPTTVSPVIVAAPDVDLSWLPLDALRARLVRSDAAAVANVVLVDCPDPDTQADADGGASAGRPRPSDANRNRDLLEAVLPACDVLVLVATAQKYKSWIVAREVAAFAPGRPLLFVQTHASRDPDIRADWRRELETQGFDVPRIFRVDGVEAAARAAAGLEPDPGFRELLEAIDGELAGRAARRVRRTGAVDLTAWFTRQSEAVLAPQRGPVEALAAGVTAKRRRLETLLAREVGERLRSERGAWQRIIADDVVGRWHGGPFAAFLHVVAAIGGLWNRVRPGRGLVGRLLAGRPAVGAATGWHAVEDLGLAAGEVEQSRSILAGLAARAAIGAPLVGRARLDAAGETAATAAVVERAGAFLATGIERLVAERRARVGSPLLHWVFEALFAALLVVVLVRAGWSFFHGNLWEGRPVSGVAFLQESLVWIVLWGLLLRWIVFALVRVGLDRSVAAFVRGVEGAGLVDPLLADFSAAAAATGTWAGEGEQLAAAAERLAATCGGATGLGRLRRAAT